MPDDDRGFSPPYNVPWATYLNTLDRVCADLPNRVDRSYLSSQSGTIQGYLLSAFRGFGLIDAEFRPEPVLLKMAQEPDNRPQMMAELLGEHYPEAVQLGASGKATMGELEAAFTSMFPRVTGESRTKAIRFFLAAANYADLPRSPLWKAPKSAGPGRKSTRRRTAANGGPDSGSTGPSAPTGFTDASMRKAYFDLLLKKAEAQDQVDETLLNRIEKLIGAEREGSAP